MKTKDPKAPVIFTLTGNRKSQLGGSIFDNVPFLDIINYMVDGKLIERKIRYIKGSISIFADEQPKEYDAKWEKEEMRPKSLRIHNGTILVDPSDVLLLEYLELCNYNATNPSRKESTSAIFEKFDPEAISQTNNKNRSREIEAMNAVRVMDFNHLKAHLVATASDGTLSSINRFRDMGEEQLRDTAYLQAKANPNAFLESLKSKVASNKYIVINAYLRGIVVRNPDTGNLTWPNGDVIMTGANGMNSIDALAEFAVDTPQYRTILDDLLQKMKDRMSPEEKKALGSVDEEEEVLKDMYDKLIDSCIKKKIITQKNASMWYYISNPEGSPDDMPVVKFNGLKLLKEGLKENGKKLYLELMDRLEGVAA